MGQRLLSHTGAGGVQLTHHVVLTHDVNPVAKLGRGAGSLRHLHQPSQTTHFVQLVELLQLLHQSVQLQRLAVLVLPLDGPPEAAMLREVEHLFLNLAVNGLGQRGRAIQQDAGEDDALTLFRVRKDGRAHDPSSRGS